MKSIFPAEKCHWAGMEYVVSGVVEALMKKTIILYFLRVLHVFMLN